MSAIPFTAAAHEHVEPITTQTVTPGAAVVQQGPFDVPAYGYLRHIFVEVVGAGGVIGAGVLHPDYPFNLFQQLYLLDVNGTPLCQIDGYALLWSNIMGGYSFRQDPRLAPWYVGTINAQFALRIPVEISHHNALGALANQNAAAAYKLGWTINPSTALFTTAPTTIPTFTIRAQLEAWSLPNATDLAGRPQQQVPPAHGTTQYFSQFSRSVVAGNQSFLLPRVGNMIRFLAFICRNNTAQGAGSTARDDTVMPNPIQISWDARILTLETQNYRTMRMAETLVPNVTRDAGVFVFPFDHSTDNSAGDDDPDLWLQTVQSSRLELDGTNATAGTIQVVTNDVAPVEVQPSQRYVETSASGFHPRIGEPTVAAQ